VGAQVLSAAEALANAQANTRGRWGDVRDEQDAARRTHAGYADIAAVYDGPKLSRADGVFALGSCFAREIETHLDLLGGRVLSLDAELQARPEFQDLDGRYRNAYFHRYTPQALSHEVLWALGEDPRWDPDKSLLVASGANLLDLNYGWTESGSRKAEAVRERRRLAAAVTRRVLEARCIIVTLGLIEAWRHRPSGLFCNKVHPRLLRGEDAEYELVVTGVEEAVEELERLDAVLRRRHARGDYQLVVTVSPVPLQQTFRPLDIVIANAESKAVLRAAAAEFVRRHDHAHYFPSFELVMFTRPDLAWLDDGVHVQPRLVKRITRQFTDLVFADLRGSPEAAMDDVVGDSVAG
jgi:hypothetical protein